MSIIYLVLPVAVVLASCAVAAFIWAARGGQFDDLDTPPIRAVHGDDAES